MQLPLYLLIALGCYMLGKLGLDVASVHDCDDAAEELAQQVRDAKADLKKQGIAT